MAEINGTNNALFKDLGLGVPEQQVKDKLGQTDFMELLVAQMRFQNPLEPQTNGEFLSQMAQFGTVEGINKMQSSFANLSSALQSNQALQASALVGRSVYVQGSQTQLTDSNTMKGTLELPSSAADISINITNQQGELVRRIHLPTSAAGSVDFAWDGMTDAGTRAASGTYRIEAQGTMAGERAGIVTTVAANVNSVTLGKDGQGMMLNLGGIGEVDVSQIKRIN